MSISVLPPCVHVHHMQTVSSEARRGHLASNSLELEQSIVRYHVGAEN